jgi:hypothetical protein
MWTIYSSILNSTHHWLRVMKYKIIGLFVAIIIAGSISSIGVSASQSGMIYNGSTLNDVNNEGSSYVAVNPNNTIIASSYSNRVILHNSEDLSPLTTFELTRDIYDLQFSPDGKTLAISIFGIAEVEDSLVFYDVLADEVMNLKSKSNNRRSSIDWSPDGDHIAVANLQNGVNIIDFETLQVESVLSNQHQDDVTCIKYSNDGQMLISGDESGSIKLWNNDGSFTGKSFDLGDEIVGCGFNYQNQRVSAVSGNGNLSTWTLTGNELHRLKLPSANGIQWSNSLDEIYVMESGDEPKLIQIDGSTFGVITQLYFIHKAIDFDISMKANGQLEDIYVSTDTVHIANYAIPELPLGYGQAGADLDGDRIPDNLDDDDDGDSILDEWDFNCLETISQCQRNPDLENIRSVNIKISNSMLIIEDTYTFGLYESAEIRNLTRRSIIADQQISYQEANLFERASCLNTDQSEIINSWRESIELSIGQVSNGTINCQVTEGLALTKSFTDDGIKLSFIISFEVVPNLSIPLEITINNQISHSDKSITHLVEHHPIYVTTEIDDVVSEGKLWWKNDGSVNVTFTESDKSEDDIVDSVIDNMLQNLLLLVGITTIGVLFIFTFIRRKNRIAIDIDDEESEEEYEYSMDDEEDVYDDDIYDEEEEYDDKEYTASKPEPLSKMEIQLNDGDEKSLDYLDTIDESPSNRRGFRMDEDNQEISSEVKRRSGKMERNRQGPIMSTKRKILGGEQQNNESKKTNIRTVKKKVKTRKVRK